MDEHGELVDNQIERENINLKKQELLKFASERLFEAKKKNLQMSL